MSKKFGGRKGANDNCLESVFHVSINEKLNVYSINNMAAWIESLPKVRTC